MGGGGGLGGITKTVLGGGGSPGALGMGRFKSSAAPIDEKAFKIRGAEKLRKQAYGEKEAARERSQAAQAGQKELISQLQDRAAGKGPSLAEAQLKQAQDRGLAQQLAAAGRARGGSAAALQRTLARQQAAGTQDVAQQAAQARIQETQSAQQQLGTILGREQALSDQLVQNFMAQGFNIAQAQQQAKEALEKLKVNQNLGLQGLNQSSFDASAGRRAEFGGGILQGAGMAFGMSDENQKKNVKDSKTTDPVEKPEKVEINKRKEDGKSKVQKFAEGFGKATNKGKGNSAVQEGGKAAGAGIAKGLMAMFSSDQNKKKNIKKSSKEAESFMNALQAKTYEYKDPSLPGAGPGRRMGVMAQDVEKSKMGKEFVVDTPNGKMLDLNKGFGAVLAAQANLHKRMKEIEKKKKKKG